MALRGLRRAMRLGNVMAVATRTRKRERKVTFNARSSSYGLRKALAIWAVSAVTLSMIASFIISPTAQAAALPKLARPSGTPLPLPQTNLPANVKAGTVVTISTCVQPPSNVDATTFTDAQLAEYGLPPRSLFSTAAAFDTTVRAMKHRDCQVIVGSKSQEFGEMSQSSTDWGGYYEYAGDWSSSFADFYVPALQNCSSATPGRDGVWGGIGGVNNGDVLVQSGTVDWCYDPYAGNPNAAYYQAFIENVGASNPNPEFATWQPSPGDHMESLIGSAPCDYMGITDYNSGNYLAASYGPCPQQNYFDCIEENDADGHLAKDSVVNFTECEGYDVPQGKYLVMGNSSSNYWDDTLYDRPILGTKEAINSTPPNAYEYGSFTITWNSRT